MAASREERIRRRAQEIYEQRKAAGFEDAGDAASDWLQAEEEIDAEDEGVRRPPGSA